MELRPAQLDTHERTFGPTPTWLFVLAALMQIASLSQLPLLQENVIAKVGLSISEFAVLAILLWQTRMVPKLGRWFGIILLLVVLRFVYAWLIGYVRYGSTLAGALQEGRFGLLITIAPVAFLLFRNMTVRNIGDMVLGLTGVLIIADILVTWFFVRTGYLSIGGRGSSRYVISVIPIVLFVWIRMIISIQSNEPLRYQELGSLSIAFLHIVLFSTSRSEAMLCGSIIGQWIYVRQPLLRWPLLAIVLGVIYFAYVSIQPSGDSQIAGRDYRAAIAYSRDAFPFGIGLVPEAIQKIQLGTAGNFFASDYGPILLVYRYGIVGVGIAIAMLYMWLRFFVKTMTIPGTYIVAAGIIAYFMIVPLLDYGSMIGGLLIGAILAVMASAPRAQGDTAELMPKRQSIARVNIA